MVATRPAPADAPGAQVEAATPPPARPRRPWWERLEIWTGAAIVVACCVFVLFQLQPDLLLRNTTTAGGDTGAHVWWPAFLRDHLLPQGRIAGWAPDWYAGFPAGQFYFPFPALRASGRGIRLRARLARTKPGTGAVRGRGDDLPLLQG